jgi:hypothetical protein
MKTPKKVKNAFAMHKSGRSRRIPPSVFGIIPPGVERVDRWSAASAQD